MTISPRPPLWSRFWFLTLLRLSAGLMLVLLAVGVGLNALGNVPDHADFLLFYASAKSWLRGEGLYQLFFYIQPANTIVFAPGVVGDRLDANLNPPIVTLLFLPLAQLDIRTAYYVFNFVQVTVALWLFLFFIKRTFGSHPALMPAATLALAAFFPVLANLMLGQVGLLVFSLMMAAWLALDRDLPRRAGLFLGAALLMKLFVGLVFIWLALTRRWLVLLWAAMVYIVGSAASLLYFGVQNHLDWVRVIARHKAGSLSWNASLEGVLGRYFGASDGVISYFNWPLFCFGLRVVAWILSAWALIWLSRQVRALGEVRVFRLGFALTLPLMLLLAPLGWIYYFPLLLLAAALLWRENQSLGRPRWVQAGILAALVLAGSPQLISGSDFYTPSLWKHYDLGGYETKVDGVIQTVHFGIYDWFEIPELFTLALVLLSALAVRIALRQKREGVAPAAKPCKQ